MRPENIGFRDRPLKSWEDSHYYCKECGESVHPDLSHHHRCKRREERK